MTMTKSLLKPGLDVSIVNGCWPSRVIIVMRLLCEPCPCYVLYHSCVCHSSIEGCDVESQIWHAWSLWHVAYDTVQYNKKHLCMQCQFEVKRSKIKGHCLQFLQRSGTICAYTDQQIDNILKLGGGSHGVYLVFYVMSDFSGRLTQVDFITGRMHTVRMRVFKLLWAILRFFTPHAWHCTDGDEISEIWRGRVDFWSVGIERHLRSTFCNSHFLFSCLRCCVHALWQEMLNCHTTNMRRSASTHFAMAELKWTGSEHAENYKLPVEFSWVPAVRLAWRWAVSVTNENSAVLMWLVTQCISSPVIVVDVDCRGRSTNFCR